MLFRTNKGDLIEIKKYNFHNDNLYYQKLIEIKKPLISSENKSFAKLKKTFNNKNN